MPIFRVRQQEVSVLNSFNFGTNIYPCVEILRPFIRKSPTRKDKPGKESKKIINPKPQKKFHEIYLPLLNNIKAERVFVDIPVHLKAKGRMDDDIVQFLSSVAGNRKNRTEYLLRLNGLQNKIIPVISSFYEISTEKNSIKTQVLDLKKLFKNVAVRIFSGRDAFMRDIVQVEDCLDKDDYLIMDWGNEMIDYKNADHQEFIDRLKEQKCKIIAHRNPIAHSITNKGLVHNEPVETVDNSLSKTFKSSGATAFSDYAGIKKDLIIKAGGGGVSPGFLFYDGVKNVFYGFKGRPAFAAYSDTIIPAVIKSDATQRMKSSQLEFLGDNNKGWKIITDISKKKRPGNSPSLFKLIAMEHYLHCIKRKIEAREIK
jgi:hypothetical protein